MTTTIHTGHTEPTLQQFLLAGRRSWIDNPKQGVIPINLPPDFLPTGTD